MDKYAATPQEVLGEDLSFLEKKNRNRLFPIPVNFLNYNILKHITI